MTTNEMVTLFKSDREKYKSLLPELWERTNGILFKMSRRFYNRHKESCARCGVELKDLDSGLYLVFLNALNSFRPDEPTMFTTYFNHHFQIMTAELLNIRTERGRQEPLNNADSLNREIEQDDGSSTTLLDLLVDKESCFEDSVIDDLGRDAEAQIIRQSVATLPETERFVIQRHYFDGKDLKAIGAELGVSGERVRQIRQKAFTILRRDKQLRTIWIESWQHKKAVGCSRFEMSPQYFAIYKKLREKPLSYGRLQAELYRMERRFDAEDYAARQADGSDDQKLVDGIAGILADYLTRQKLTASL